MGETYLPKRGKGHCGQLKEVVVAGRTKKNRFSTRERSRESVLLMKNLE